MHQLILPLLAFLSVCAGRLQTDARTADFEGKIETLNNSSPFLAPKIPTPVYVTAPTTVGFRIPNLSVSTVYPPMQKLRNTIFLALSTPAFPQA